jgi:UDP:flavonoid glycosyltransferase YjiC (YdhE family)
MASMKIGIQTWGTEGDVRPFIALAGGLSTAGHAVTLAVTAVNRDFTSFSENLNFKFRLVGYIDYDDEGMRSIGDRILKERNFLKQVHIIITYFFDPIAEDILSAAKLLCQENDLLIRHGLTYPLAVAAEQRNLPCISVFPTAQAIPTKYSSPLITKSFGKLLNSLMWKFADTYVNRIFKSSYNRLRRLEGLRPIKSVLKEVWASTDLNLIAVSPTLFPPAQDWKEHIQVCGFLNIPEGSEDWKMPVSLKEFIQAGSPPVYMTFGAMIEGEPAPQESTRLMVEAARVAGCRAIIQSKWEELSGIPEHPDIYRIRRAPHLEVFPLCAAVVHAGGSGVTQSATRSGCPSVVVAHATDQTIWGGLLHQAGIAPKHLNRRSATAKKLARSIRTVLDSPKMVEKAKEIGAKMKDEDGVKRAVELIETI